MDSRRRVQAVIFDMDGLMLDTERPEREHFRKAAADFGYSDLESIYLQTVGKNWRDTRRFFQEALGERFPFDELRECWRRYVKAHCDEFGVPVKPGLQPLLRLLDQLRLPKAVATSTQKADALALLERVEILQHFSVVVAGDEVTRGKPDPEIFLTAAERLKVNPENCVVFEDSPTGLKAAHAAGMIPILVPDLIPPPPEIRDIAYRVLDSLEDALPLFGQPGFMGKR
jgi:HAD superfamily hydrolase (TIGR01509 family)